MKRSFLIALILLMAGCGYHTPDTADSWVGGDAQLLYVRLFDNRTAQPYLDNFMTDALIAELSRSRLFELTEDEQRAEVVLAGVIESFRSGAQAYVSTDRIAEYRANMVVSAQLQSSADGAVLWKNRWQRSEDYSATPTSVDKGLQLDAEQQAARLAAQRLAEDIAASLLGNF